jgi:predicted RNase H-like nuclease
VVSIEAGRVAGAWAAASLAQGLAGESPSTVVGVDIPLGGTPDTWRTADAEAKRRLGPRHPRVFLVPPRPVWGARSHAEAARLCQALTGKRVSIQAYGLFARMLEAERYRDLDRQPLFEIHPELVFADLAGGPVAANKKTPDGERIRRALLRRAGLVVPTVASVPTNDVLDAAAVAWCAYQIAGGAARHLPAEPDQRDHRGRPILIWY